MNQIEPFEGARSWSVYYCYAADGTLLYVGQSEDPAGRFVWHKYYSPAEWPNHCVRIEIAPPVFAKADVRALERAEIARLHPACNVHHNREPVPWVADLTARLPYGDQPEVVHLGEVAERAS